MKRFFSELLVLVVILFIYCGCYLENKSHYYLSIYREIKPPESNWKLSVLNTTKSTMAYVARYPLTSQNSETEVGWEFTIVFHSDKTATRSFLGGPYIVPKVKKSNATYI